MSADNHYPLRVSADELLEFVKEALQTVGVVDEVADLTAHGLVSTSLRGVDSHGIRLLPHYTAGVEGGRLNPNPNLSFEQTGYTTGILDADHTFGHAAGIVGMQHAMQLADETGCGFVAVKNSSHCGALAYYGLEAARQDMIGLAFTHASPKMMSPGSNRPFFGTNPVCITAPMLDEEPYCFDAASTILTSNEIKRYREAGKPLPPGVAADQDGNETSDPSLVFQLLPIGDYKGFGLAMTVDILCALLTGMPAGQSVSIQYGNSLSEKRHLGHFFGAIRIDVFEEPQTFKRRLQELANQVRSEPRKNPNRPVQVPGDPEKEAQAERTKNGIPISPSTAEKLDELASRLGISPGLTARSK